MFKMKYSENSHGIVSMIGLTRGDDVAVSWAATHTCYPVRGSRFMATFSQPTKIEFLLNFIGR
jgi:hypothetical protein